MPRLIDHGLRDGKKAKKAKAKKSPPKPKSKKGRPTLYTEALGKEICDRFEQGESLLSISKSAHMPSYACIHNWGHDDDHPFSEKYARAREIGYCRLAEEILDIADDGRNDFLQRAKDDGEVVLVDHDHISRSRLRIDSRKWYLSKVLPKVFGDNLSPVSQTVVLNLTAEKMLADIDCVGGRIPQIESAAERLALADR